jgi:hypothetical protein
MFFIGTMNQTATPEECSAGLVVGERFCGFPAANVHKTPEKRCRGHRSEAW